MAVSPVLQHLLTYDIPFPLSRTVLRFIIRDRSLLLHYLFP